MMIFSNTTPMIALSSINQLNLLPTLFNAGKIKSASVGWVGVKRKPTIPLRWNRVGFHFVPTHHYYITLSRVRNPIF